MFCSFRIEDEELRFLLTGGVSLDNKNPNPCPDWLTEKMWNEICKAAELQRMIGFKEHFERNVSWHPSNFGHWLCQKLE